MLKSVKKYYDKLGEYCFGKSWNHPRFSGLEDQSFFRELYGLFVFLTVLLLSVFTVFLAISAVLLILPIPSGLFNEYVLAAIIFTVIAFSIYSNRK